MLSSIIKLILLVFGAAGLFGGPYYYYLATTRPRIFAKPRQAKWQSLVAFVVGVILLGILFIIMKR